MNLNVFFLLELHNKQKLFLILSVQNKNGMKKLILSLPFAQPCLLLDFFFLCRYLIVSEVVTTKINKEILFK